MANLKDIAQKLGVSVSTVSRGLNGGKEISREMTEKILKAADELGYTLQGRGGRATPDWNSAGIIVPEVASEYYARLVHKAKDFLAAKGYSLIMKLTDFKAAELLDAINTMSRIHVKCLLVVMDTEENMSDQLISAMHRSGLPIMLITSKYYPLLEFDCIHLDEYSGIIMGVQHLQKRGYQRIACISDRISLSRVTVFKQAMKLQGMKVDPQLICVGPERAESGGYLRTKELLSLENPPDAVFCCYDQMAIGAIQKPPHVLLLPMLYLLSDGRKQSPYIRLVSLLLQAEVHKFLRLMEQLQLQEKPCGSLCHSLQPLLCNQKYLCLQTGFC